MYSSYRPLGNYEATVYYLVIYNLEFFFMLHIVRQGKVKFIYKNAFLSKWLLGTVQ